MGCKNKGIRLWNNDVSHVAAIKHKKYISAQERHSDMGTDVAYTYCAELGGQLLLLKGKGCMRSC